MIKSTLKATFDYSNATNELDTILTQLQQPDVTVDTAIVAYKRGLVLIEQLEMHLRSAQQTIAEIGTVDMSSNE
jgi:exodeoxyribonuclease VII small subunit